MPHSSLDILPKHLCIMCSLTKLVLIWLFPFGNSKKFVEVLMFWLVDILGVLQVLKLFYMVVNGHNIPELMEGGAELTVAGLSPEEHRKKGSFAHAQAQLEAAHACQCERW